MSTVEMNNAAREYRQLQQEIKALQEQADALKAQMMAEMGARQADSIQTGEYTIRYNLYQSSRIDTDAIKAAGLYEQYSKTTTAVRFQVA